MRELRRRERHNAARMGRARAVVPMALDLKGGRGRGAGELLREVWRGFRRNNQPTKHQMPTQPYVPAALAAFSNWLSSFEGALAGAPGSYNLTAPEVAPLTAARTAFDAAYATSTDPATRTSVTVAATATARSNAESLARQFAQRIQVDTTISDALKIAAGCHGARKPPTPVPPPTVAPVLGLQGVIPGQSTYTVKEPGAAGKAKPEGVVGIEIRRGVVGAGTLDPETLANSITATKSPVALANGGFNAGQIVGVFARYTTRGGPGGVAQVGPWSAVLTHALV